MHFLFSRSLKFLFFLSFFSISTIDFAQCKVSQLVDGNKVNIPAPYKYDGFLMDEFNFNQLNKEDHLEFVAFKNQKYKLFFYASEFEESVTISIYDKKKPKVKIAEKIINADSTSWIYEPPKSGITYSINYEISPSNTEVEHSGCMVMLIGFTNK